MDTGRLPFLLFFLLISYFTITITNSGKILSSLKLNDDDVDGDKSITSTPVPNSNDNGEQSYIIIETKSGENFRVVDAVEDVKKEPHLTEDDQIVSAYVYGLWMFYSEPNFNWKNNALVPNSHMEWVYSPNEAKPNEFTIRIKSFRPVGNPTNIKSSSFTLFLGINFTGPTYSTNDSDYPNMPYTKSKSLVITGNQPWFIYSGANFVQKDLCIIPTDGIALIPDYYLKKKTRPLRHLNSVWLGGCAAVEQKCKPSWRGGCPYGVSKAPNLYFGDGIKPKS